LRATHRIPYQSINGPDSEQTLRSLDPDWLLVCGAPILSERILSIPRVCTVNVHFGIAPEYRGQDSLFWTLYRRDYEKIGFTLHEVDAGIDTGPILARGFPALSASETEATLWGKCARMAVGIADDMLHQATCQPLTKMGSSSHFRLRRARDRTIRKELHFWWRQRQMHGRIPVRPARVERFYSGQQNSPITSPS
jgi:methionyl-tRNA formyltransferase